MTITRRKAKNRRDLSRTKVGQVVAIGFQTTPGSLDGVNAVYDGFRGGRDYFLTLWRDYYLEGTQQDVIAVHSQPRAFHDYNSFFGVILKPSRRLSVLKQNDRGYNSKLERIKRSGVLN